MYIRFPFSRTNKLLSTWFKILLRNSSLFIIHFHGEEISSNYCDIRNIGITGILIRERDA